MSKKIKYVDAQTFMFACVRYGVLPLIHWREGRGFIWFKPLCGCVAESGEVHIFYSNSKPLLDAIWNSIGLIKHAVKVVNVKVIECDEKGV